MPRVSENQQRIAQAYFYQRNARDPRFQLPTIGKDGPLEDRQKSAIGPKESRSGIRNRCQEVEKAQPKINRDRTIPLHSR
jgi:hypothetical protein